MGDKRTLLAFLLIGLILLLIPYYYEWMGLGPKPAPPAPVEDTSSEPRQAVEPAPTTHPDPLIQSGDKLEQDPFLSPSDRGSFTPRHISVHTPQQELTFSTLGGNIVSARLLKYDKTEGQSVELVPPGGQGFSLSLGYKELTWDLSDFEFVPSQEQVWVDSGETRALKFSCALEGGRTVEKNFIFSGDRYGMELEVNLQGFHEDTDLFLSWDKGIASTEAKERSSSFLFVQPNMSRRLMAYLNEERTELESGDESKIWSDKGPLKWAGVRNQYFLVALAPRDPGYYRVELKAPAEGQYSHDEDISYKVGARLGTSGRWRSLLYLGPLSYDELASYNADLEHALDLGFPIIREISKGLLIVFLATHKYVPNYGVVIILIAVAIKILVYPLTHKSYESMAKMQQLQPKMAALREKYKNDNQRLSRETMKLYKEEGVNPLGGCLPMLLQMPIFFALYNVFSSTIELRQAPFVLWIDDLSQPDVIDFGGFELHVLPLLMAGSMFVQQKMTMKDPKQAFLVYLMPAFMIFIFWSISSGLVLYWTIFNVLSIGQQYLINRIKGS